MIKREEVYKIGMINKPHGIHGELLFTFTDDIFDQVDADYLICLLDGIFVPFFMEEYRFRTDTTAFVKFEDIDTAEKARRFTNIDVYFPVKYANEKSEDSSLSWDYFVGLQVKDIHYGDLGVIEEVDESTINTLFVVRKGDEELLIPAQEDFIVNLEEEKRILWMELPEGLIDMDKALQDDV